MYRVVYFFLIKETPVNSIVYDFIQICIPKVISGLREVYTRGVNFVRIFIRIKIQ